MTPEPARQRLADTQRNLARRLADAGIQTAALDARLLVLLATGLSHERLVVEPERPLTPAEAGRLDELVSRRLAGEPVSRLRGEREFFGLSFSLGPSTLDPRPDTEILVELALDFAKTQPQPLRILDLGTGSGAILVSLLARLPTAKGTGTDRSAEALAVARRNAGWNGVGDRAEFLSADWCEGLVGSFDLIVSNPPYIASGDIGALPVEVSRFDPHGALDGGPDGLDPYRAIAAGAGRLLASEGLLAVEIGAGQKPEVAEIFGKLGWMPAPGLSERTDLGGRIRALGFSHSKLGVGNREPKG